ncbi:MAG: SLBB domain-containing protein [Acidobacteriota bacterium]
MRLFLVRRCILFGAHFLGTVMKSDGRAIDILVLGFLCFLLLPIFVAATGLQEAVAGRRTGQAFTLVDGIPEPKLGPSDVLNITVWNGETREEERIRIAQDGTLFIPFGVNQTLNVTGLTSSDLKERIEQELLVYFRQVVVQVVFEEFHSNRAYLLGEVVSGTGQGPGLYALEGRKRVLEFVIEHGGFTSRANLTEIQLNRADGEVVLLNLSDVIFQADESQNPIVNPGDIVWVPSREIGSKNYFVFGEVSRPGVVSAPGDLTLLEVVSLAGSMTLNAERDTVYVARAQGDSNQPEVLKLDLKRLMEKGDFSQNIALQSNEVIFVPQRGLSRFNDVIRAITPIISLVRDTTVITRR